MKSFTPLILIVASVGIFFLYIDPLYQNEIKERRNQIAEYDSLLANARELLEKDAEISTKYNSINPTDIENLEKLLPDTIDNVRLIIDLQGIARNNGLTLSGLSLSESSNASAEQARRSIATAGEQSYGSITVSFGVTASYEAFMVFLKDLEQSLRLIDVVNLSVAASPTGFYNYSLTIKTYWLK
jgi:Tfp pilus assembly protein PilO